MNRLCALLPILLVCACASQNSPYLYFEKQNLPKPTQETFPHCYNYGCDTVVTIEFTENDWSKIDSIFSTSSTNAEKERSKIAKAIGLFEQIVGKKAGTENDMYGTFRNVKKFQHDCIDESTNTSVYLTLLEQRGHIKYHSLSSPDTRLPFIHGGRWPHRTAVIYELETGTAYAVDSWFHDNGFPAEIIQLKLWKQGWKVEENFRKSSDSFSD